MGSIFSLRITVAAVFLEVLGNAQLSVEKDA
jgi:hypothetical protein